MKSSRTLAATNKSSFLSLSLSFPPPFFEDEFFDTAGALSGGRLHSLRSATEKGRNPSDEQEERDASLCRRRRPQSSCFDHGDPSSPPRKGENRPRSRLFFLPLLGACDPLRKILSDGASDPQSLARFLSLRIDSKEDKSSDQENERHQRKLNLNLARSVVHSLFSLPRLLLSRSPEPPSSPLLP
jgi:hypothetical protein